METHKEQLEEKLYVTKVQFEQEFLAYKEINSCCYKAFLAVHELSNASDIGGLKTDARYVIEIGEKMTTRVIELQNKLLEFEIFIPKDICDSYAKIRGRMVDYNQEILDRLLHESEQEDKKIGDIFHKEDEKTFDEIYELVEHVDNMVRERLAKLQIL